MYKINESPTEGLKANGVYHTIDAPLSTSIFIREYLVWTFRCTYVVLSCNKQLLTFLLWAQKNKVFVSLSWLHIVCFSRAITMIFLELKRREKNLKDDAVSLQKSCFGLTWATLLLFLLLLNSCGWLRWSEKCILYRQHVLWYCSYWIAFIVCGEQM